MGMGREEESSVEVNFQLSSHVEQGGCPHRDNGKLEEEQTGVGRREGKDHEFNFGLESEVIIEETYEWACRVAAGYMVSLGEISI